MGIDIRRQVYYGEVTWDPASLADGATTSQQVVIPDVVFGDLLQVAAPYDLQDCLVQMDMTANGSVWINIYNESGGVRDFASGVWRVKVTKRA